MIYRGDGEVIPHGQTTLQAGDTLLIQLTGPKAASYQRQLRQAAGQGQEKGAVV